MSYIKIEIGGRERGLKFNQLAMQEFSLNYGRHAKLFETAPELFFVYNIFHSGLIGNAFAKGEDVDFTFHDVIDWVDALYEDGKDEDRAAVVKVFSDTRWFKDAIEATKSSEPVVEKKSQQPKKKSSSAKTMKTTGASVQSLRAVG